MGFVESNCPICGKKIRESCNAWVYGSPIRRCPKCRSEFLDKRWREVAIEEFDPRTNNQKLYLCGILDFLVFTVLCVGWLIMMIHTQKRYPKKLIGCIMIGIVGTIGCALVLLRQVTGYEDKINSKFMEESKRRMQNKEYVEKLVSYGYPIPDQYRK